MVIFETREGRRRALFVVPDGELVSIIVWLLGMNRDASYSYAEDASLIDGVPYREVKERKPEGLFAHSSS